MLERTFMIAKKKLAREISRWRRAPIRLIVLAGRRKSGKDVFISYVRRNYPGFRRYRFAQAPDLIAKILELPIERRIQQALFGVNALLYPILGESAYKRRVAKMVDREKPKLAIIESARTKEEYEEFVIKRKGILVGFRADDKIRHERARKDAGRKHKKQDEDTMSFSAFMSKERPVIERYIDWIVGRAHFILTNDSDDYQTFYKKIDAVMHELGISKKRGKTGAPRG